MRTLGMATLAVLMLAVTTVPVSADPADPPCLPDAFNQADLAGIYVSAANQMRITIYPCGGTVVLWANAYGTHEAGYLSTQRMPAGGIIATIAARDPVAGSLDGRITLGVKPAEAGWIQAITISPFADDMRVYRLRKIA